jgi:Ca2+:H+ antiporter
MGLVGLCLLLGRLRYREQVYNLYGANAFLTVIVPLAVLGLVLPSFTVSSPDRTFSPFQSIFYAVMAVGLYGVFLAIQTLGHREYFIAPGPACSPAELQEHEGLEVRPASCHTLFLLAHLVIAVILAGELAVPIDYGISVLGAPPSLGGLLVAVLVLSPECLAAVRAALANQLQRSINLSLGGCWRSSA